MRRTFLIGMASIALTGVWTGCTGPGEWELVDKGIADFKAGRYADAKAALAQANATRPQDPDTLFYLGRTHHAQGHFTRAVYFYQCCMDAAPGYPGVRKYLDQAQKQAGALGDRLRFVPDPVRK